MNKHINSKPEMQFDLKLIQTESDWRLPLNTEEVETDGQYVFINTKTGQIVSQRFPRRAA
jgi:hypothetical protein